MIMLNSKLSFCSRLMSSITFIHPNSVSVMQPAGWKLKGEYLPSGWLCLVHFIVFLCILS